MSYIPLVWSGKIKEEAVKWGESSWKHVGRYREKGAY